MKIWTLTVDDDHGIQTTVHTIEDECIASLRENYDPEGEFGNDVLERLTDEGGLVVYIDEHEVPDPAGLHEDRRWLEFEEHAVMELMPMLQSSSVVASLVPKGPSDIKYAVELGLSIMMDKPIIAIVMTGAHVPEHLRRVADVIVEGDPSDPGFAQKMNDAVASVTGEA